MNNLLKNLVLLLVFGVVFSGLSACTSSANTVNKPDSETVQPSNETVKKEDSKYPAIPAALNLAEIKKLDDSTFKMDDKKGNVVLLNLWATWCGPCRSEMPHLNEMQDTYRNKNFEIIGLNTDDESVEDINKFADEMKLNYTMAYADGALMKELINLSKFQGIPQSFLIDREGKLRGVFLGGGKNVIGKMKETVEKVVNE